MSAKNWWTVTDRSCVVMIQEVVEPNVGKKIRSKENPLRSGLNPVYVAIANEIGVWLFSDEDDK